MIVSRIEGGLGNQMFQYAYGLYLAGKHQVPLTLDLSSYGTNPSHGYLLDRFCIEARHMGESRRRVPYKYQFAHEKSWRTWLGLSSPLRLVRERPFGFAEKYLNIGNDSYLAGYWQSEKFFPGMRSLLLEQFRVGVPLSDATRRLGQQLREGNSIAVHVRRGDYLTNPVNARLYQELASDYYRRCVHDWAAHRSQVHVYVFSNDLDWCKANLKFPQPTSFVEHTTGQTAHEDLWMISQAACCITANSSFSWWGAWLNDRSDKTVYTPRKWFHPNTLDDRHLACESWIAVDVRQSQATHSVDESSRAA